MAITKILARHGGLKDGLKYILNGDKTDDQILTATHLCSKDTAYAQMMRLKQNSGKTDGVQYYHVIQSFKPGEIEPELALEIAHQFVMEHLEAYQAVIGVHVDKHHVHSHIIFNSVRYDGRGKYHSNAKTYYTQIRTISDRLCREHGLSVIIQGENSKALSYIEWLRQSKGQPTYRSMLEADLKESVEDANDIGHFFLLMESKGYEIKHGNRLGFRLRGQEHFMYPERKNSQYSEEGVRAAIADNLLEIETGQKPTFITRQPYVPYHRTAKVKYKGLVALYYHYVYLLRSVEKRQYPPRMTAQLRKDVMQFEKIKARFEFLREHGITDKTELERYIKEQATEIMALTKQRTILNVQKKKYQNLFQALADENALFPAKQLYEDGHLGVETEFQKYTNAVCLLDSAEQSRVQLSEMKREIYTQLADLNRDIRQARKNVKTCEEILAKIPALEKEIKQAEQGKEAHRHEFKQR